MKKKMALLFMFLLLVPIISGCYSSSIGNTSLTGSSDLGFREKLLIDWLKESTVVSDGKSEVIVLDAKKKKQSVISPPNGSVFHLYQDILTKMEDGFYPFTTTEAESEFLRTLMAVYEEERDSNLLNRASLIADRLNDKVFYSRLVNEDVDIALIPRTTVYNFEKEIWEDTKEEVYTEDILNSTIALIDYSRLTNTKKYDKTIKSLLRTISVYQNQIKKEQSSFYDGALYYKLFLKGQSKQYVPSWNIYPLYMTLDIYKAFSLASDYLEDTKYLSISNDYLEWVNKKLTDKKGWEHYGKVPYVGVNGNKEYLSFVDGKWQKSNHIPSKLASKMIYGLELSGKSNDYSRVLDSVIYSKKDMPSYYTKLSGEYSFKDVDWDYVSKLYALSYKDLIGVKDQDLSVLKIFKNQRLRGENIVVGTWQRNGISMIAGTSEIIRLMSKLYEK